MEKEPSRIETLKEKVEQRRIAIDIFGEKAGEVIFLDSITSKTKLLKSDEMAYKNIKMKFKRDNNELDEARRKFDLMVYDFLNSHPYEISFFVFGKNAYELTVPASLFLNFYGSIKKTINQNDIIIHTKCLSSGLCLLFDEHYISISQWHK
ncbi:hypothetical protein B1H58_07010 [Pantoea alhagi]|uniref:Uncharacterized protein n=1 Tax=Pantoea alhagi TaxID=1891675 RepID=A0A1W6B3Z8_9GAMM|nr:hypothetical protein [Pantoea alhagi]ARJ41794.1 hypothetical protein B1H58_07010 [Pantoea alhagi]